MAIHTLISGRVQGVNYRYYTRQQAQKLGVNGWVKNLHDGRVEAFFEGNPETVEKMVKWCEKGSPSAVVNEVLTQEKNPQNLQDFKIIYD